MLQENNPCEFIHQTFIDEGAELMQVMNNMILVAADSAAIMVAPGREDDMLERMIKLFTLRFRATVIRQAQIELEQRGQADA